LGEQDVTWWAATYVRDLAASKLTTSTHRPMRMRADKADYVNCRR